MLATLCRPQERPNTKYTHGTWGHMKMRTWKRALIHLSKPNFSIFLEVYSFFIYKVNVSPVSKVRFNPNGLKTQFRPGKIRWRILFQFRRATRHVAINITTQLIQHHPSYISKAKRNQSRCVYLNRLLKYSQRKFPLRDTLKPRRIWYISRVTEVSHQNDQELHTWLLLIWNWYTMKVHA